MRDLTSCLCSAAAWAVCFEGSVAGVNATETGNEVSPPALELTSLAITLGYHSHLVTRLATHKQKPSYEPEVVKYFVKTGAIKAMCSQIMF